MQLIKLPMVLASRHVKPANRAATVQPPNLPEYARTQIATVKPHVIPLLSRPRSVESPESVKYYYNVRDRPLKWVRTRTKGRKIMDTISSSFSVKAMASPPLRGTMTPARNAPDIEDDQLECKLGEVTTVPKIAWTPIMSVMNADPKRMSIVTVMKKIVGPFSIDPVFLASHRRQSLTGNNRNKVHPTQVNKIQSAIKPDPALTSATDRASNVHPTMSFPTPAERTTMPTVVSKSFSSVKIRQRTGKAVMEYATPVNNMKWVNLTDWSMKVLYRGTARAAPKPKGMVIPARATVADRRALRLMTEESISRPTRNRKRQSPMLAVRLR